MFGRGHDNKSNRTVTPLSDENKDKIKIKIK